MLIVVDGCAGLNDNLIQAGFVVYPNPTSNQITIDAFDQQGSFDISILTLDGRVVTTITNTTEPKVMIDLSEETNGVYLLQIDNGTTKKTMKIVKK